MKLQSLAVIFIIIIMPISMVLSEYVENKIESAELVLEYDTILIDATYDAIKAYQLNTVNNQFGDVTTEKVEDIEAAVTTFFNSLVSSFNYSGYKSSVMEEYVPAVAFTTYDGYYIYSPFNNVLTEVQDGEYSEDYADGDILDGLKPYVSYTCRYTSIDGQSSGNDFIITYTLDNYITIQGTINGTYYYDYGYLYSISTNGSNTTNKIYKKSDTCYIYDGVEFNESDTESLKEYVGNETYYYVKINGKKYYLDTDYYDNTSGSRGDSEYVVVNGVSVDKTKAAIFFIDSDGTRNYSQTHGWTNNSNASNGNTDDQNDEFMQYFEAIVNNKSAFEYYKSAYEFSVAVLGTGTVNNSGYTDKAGTEVQNNGKYKLSDLKSSDAYIWSNETEDTTSLKEYSGGTAITIFDESNGEIQLSTSNFNEHRKTIIRYVVETNLTTAIASYKASTGSSIEYIMPKISENDWDIIENDVCAITFMQGMSTGASKYNGYAVVANTLTNEYIDENDIYIVTTEKTYCKANDSTVGAIIASKDDLGGYYAGVWKLNFEVKQDVTVSPTEYYVPMSGYIGSYTSIYGSYDLNVLAGSSQDMYTYISDSGNSTLKKVYYYALARERWGSYNVNNVNYELYGNTTDVKYFLNSY